MPHRLMLAVLGALSIAFAAFVAPPASAYEEIRVSVCTDSTLGGESEIKYTVDPQGDATITGFRFRHTGHATIGSVLYVQSSATNAYSYVTFTSTAPEAAAGAWSDWTTISYDSPRTSPYANVLIRKSIGGWSAFVLCDTDQTWGIGDTDADGVPDDIEGDAGTDPADTDTDNGGANDGLELNAGTNPLSAADDLPLLYPNASNTGPTGTLTAYTGPCTITTPNTVIENVVITYAAGTCDAVLIEASGVTIRNSEINNRVEVDGAGTLLIEDSEVDARGLGWPNGALRSQNITALRVDILGGKDSVQCNLNCTITNSWLHAQDEVPVGIDVHGQGFLSSGGDNITLDGNTIDCDIAFEPIGGGGCTGHLVLLADFAGLTDITVTGNYFPAADNVGWCTYAGGDPKPFVGDNANIVWSGNVWEKGPVLPGNSIARGCVFGPVTSIWPGTTWTDNTYEDGTAVG
jgi:hypothetical protein